MKASKEIPFDFIFLDYRTAQSPHSGEKHDTMIIYPKYPKIHKPLVMQTPWKAFDKILLDDKSIISSILKFDKMFS
jgi:hypothetical protein